jgi:hypothetical protein
MGTTQGHQSAWPTHMARALGGHRNQSPDTAVQAVGSAPASCGATDGHGGGGGISPELCDTTEGGQRRLQRWCSCGGRGRLVVEEDFSEFLWLGEEERGIRCRPNQADNGGEQHSPC